MKANKGFNLNKYSGIAGVFLLLHNNSEAQAIYTDLEPDIEIQLDGQTAGVDMDNNGTMDFAFLKTSGGYYFYWTFTSTQVYRFRHRIWAGPQIPSNEIAGDYHYPSYAGTIRYFPYALLSGATIDNDLSWQNWGFQILEMGAYQSSEFGFRSGNWIPDKDSNFLGVRFLDENECLHYGWIRCTTADSSKRLIIHDYAYESKCETGIAAGDTIGDTTNIAVEESTSDPFVIYSFSKNIYIYNALIEYIDAQIISIKGELLIEGRQAPGMNLISMQEFPSGFYIVNLVVGENTISKKVVIN